MPRRVGAYAKLLANYASDDAIIAAGERAELLFVRGLAFCATSDSDGYITDGQLVRVIGAGMRDAKSRAALLVREGLWERVEDGYVVRSWMKIHESTEEKGRQRRTDRERKRRERESLSDRSPSGQDAESERTTDDVTPESLDCFNAASPIGTQSNPIQSNPAHGSAPETARNERARFAEFWDAYPRKVGKPDAEKAFTKATKRTEPDAIIKAAARLRDDPNREDAFTAHPATWLNRDGWDDPPLPPRLAGRSSQLASIDPATGKPKGPGWEFGM